MALEEYNKKRDFSKSKEPKGKEGEDKQIFVVQKHDASNLHYDFRISVDGVLKSWAIPKGPSMNPSNKKLAIPTEDHPMDYADFEGTVPEGQYGAGTVMVWDKGEYENPKDKSLSEQLKEGHITVKLKGEKLKGGFALTKIGKNWIFIKMKDEHASEKDILKEEPNSVLSGKSLEEI